MPEWIWLDNIDRYRDLETGRFVSAAQVRSWSAEAAQASADSIGSLVTMLENKRLNTRDWVFLMRDEIKDVYLQQYVLGKGGLEQMTQRDWGSLGGMLRDQYRYLDQFAADIVAGRVTPAQILPRARMYARSARQAYARAHERALGMPALPDYPGSGNTVCLTNCRCYWRIQPERDARKRIVRWRCYWELTPAEHCTSDNVDREGRPLGCLQRAALWSPLIIEA